MSSDSEYSEISDVDSFATIEDNLQSLNHLITDLYGQAEELEEHLVSLQKPLEGTQVEQMGQLPFLMATPFRHATFQVKPPGFPGIDLAQRYPFHIICATLRNYIIKNGAMRTDGQVNLTPELQALFDIQEPVIGYVALLGKLRAILI
jgi:hypothetical protein